MRGFCLHPRPHTSLLIKHCERADYLSQLLAKTSVGSPEFGGRTIQPFAARPGASCGPVMGSPSRGLEPAAAINALGRMEPLLEVHGTAGAGQGLGGSCLEGSKPIEGPAAAARCGKGGMWTSWGGQGSCERGLAGHSCMDLAAAGGGEAVAATLLHGEAVLDASAAAAGSAKGGQVVLPVVRGSAYGAAQQDIIASLNDSAAATAVLANGPGGAPPTTHGEAPAAAQQDGKAALNPSAAAVAPLASGQPAMREALSAAELQDSKAAPRPSEGAVPPPEANGWPVEHGEAQDSKIAAGASAAAAPLTTGRQKRASAVAASRKVNEFIAHDAFEAWVRSGDRPAPLRW